MNVTHSNEIIKMHKKYPWLKITTTVEDYLAPEYYDKLLKDYIFSGKTDLRLFKEYLESVPSKHIDALELGCGSGRATDIFLDHFKDESNRLGLVDLSDKMLQFCKKKFKNFSNIEFFKSDSLEFLNKNNDKYDVIFSLWSFSHSVHQILIRDGETLGKRYIQETIQKMIKSNMNKGSSFFLIHFDSMSDEQRILMRQWKKVYKVYHDISIQSPSKLLIDETLQLLEKEGLIKLELKHYEGDDIVYSSLEEALEVFLNFHMESYFNESSMLPQVINELTNYFKKFTDKKGFIRIKPGCFIYYVTKII